MYYIVLCDDDSSSLQNMKKYLFMAGLNEEEVQFYEFTSGEQLEEEIAGLEQCGLCVMDMKLPDMDGDAAARVFRQYFPDAVLVFCTGVYEPTTKSFETEPYRYLLKSSTEEEMQRSMQEIVKKLQEKKRAEWISVRQGNAVYTLKPEQILYIEREKRGSRIHLLDHSGKQELKVRDKLGELYEALVQCGFAYAHDSYIVNTREIRMLRAKELVLSDGTSLGISRARETELRRAYMKCMDKYGE